MSDMNDLAYHWRTDGELIAVARDLVMVNKNQPSLAREFAIRLQERNETIAAALTEVTELEKSLDKFDHRYAGLVVGKLKGILEC